MENFFTTLQNYVESNNLLAYPLVFFSGIIVSFTPCVYALIPITIGFIGASGQGSVRKSFLLSLVYVLGLSLVYAGLGAVASLSGIFLGRITSSSWMHIFLGVVFVFLGFGALGFYNIPFVGFAKTNLRKPKSYFGSFLIGAISGFAVGPCIAPALGVILTYVAARKNIFFGTTLLITFAFGMSVLLLLLGTFSSLLKKIPKSGRFNIITEKFFAVILVIVGVWFLVMAGM